MKLYSSINNTIDIYIKRYIYIYKTSTRNTVNIIYNYFFVDWYRRQVKSEMWFNVPAAPTLAVQSAVRSDTSC